MRNKLRAFRARGVNVTDVINDLLQTPDQREINSHYISEDVHRQCENLRRNSAKLGGEEASLFLIYSLTRQLSGVPAETITKIRIFIMK